MRRRDVLKLGFGAGAAAAMAVTQRLRVLGEPRDDGSVVLRGALASLSAELAAGISIPTLGFDGIIPGTHFNLGGKLARLELHNRTDSETVIHAPVFAQAMVTIPAHTCVSMSLRTSIDSPFGVTACHAYSAAGGDIASASLALGSARDAGAFDQLHTLSIYRWRPRAIMRPAPFNDTVVAYDHVSFNDKLLCASEPIKVRCGDRVHFHFSNVNAKRGVALALPQHRFLVVALDGHRVPTPRLVERLYLGPTDSIDAVVAMDRPGRWVLGTTHRGDRMAGLGRLVEYAGARGAAVESDYGSAPWDYAEFGAAAACESDRQEHSQLPPLALQAAAALSLADAQWLDQTPQVSSPLSLVAGKRYRFSAANLTRQPQALQILHHDTELVSVAGRRTAGVRKNVWTLAPFTRSEFEFRALTDEVFLAHDRQVCLGALPPV